MGVSWPSAPRKTGFTGDRRVKCPNRGPALFCQVSQASILNNVTSYGLLRGSRAIYASLRTISDFAPLYRVSLLPYT
jgi:hypothetical protein